MKSFIDECRREWKRLGVPDPVANEMAADLASDLAEAEAEGVAPEEVLGSGAFDPRSFAASWAGARGVIPAAAPARANPLRKPVNMGALAAVSVIGALAAALVLIASHRGSSISVAPSPRALAPPVRPDELVHRLSAIDVVDALAAIVLAVAILGMLVAGYLWASQRRSRPPATAA